MRKGQQKRHLRLRREAHRSPPADLDLGGVTWWVLVHFGVAQAANSAATSVAAYFARASHALELERAARRFEKIG